MVTVPPPPRTMVPERAPRSLSRVLGGQQGGPAGEPPDPVTRVVAYEPGAIVRLTADTRTRVGRVAPAGTVGRVLRVCARAAGRAEPCYEVAASLGTSSHRRDGEIGDVELVLVAPHASLRTLKSFELLVERMKHPALGLANRLVEVLRTCWSCGQAYALRYEADPQVPLVSKDYQCPYCAAQQEELAPFADGLHVRLAVFPRSRPTKRIWTPSVSGLLPSSEK